MESLYRFVTTDLVVRLSLWDKEPAPIRRVLDVEEYKEHRQVPGIVCGFCFIFGFVPHGRGELPPVSSRIPPTTLGQVVGSR